MKTLIIISCLLLTHQAYGNPYGEPYPGPEGDPYGEPVPTPEADPYPEPPMEPYPTGGVNEPARYYRTRDVDAEPPRRMPRFAVGIMTGTMFSRRQGSTENLVGINSAAALRARMIETGHLWLQTEFGMAARTLDNNDSLGSEDDPAFRFGVFAHVDFMPESTLRVTGVIGGGLHAPVEIFEDSPTEYFGELGFGIGTRMHFRGRASLDIGIEARGGTMTNRGQTQQVYYSGPGSSAIAPVDQDPIAYTTLRLCTTFNF